MEHVIDYKYIYNNSPDMSVSVEPKTGRIIAFNQTTIDTLGFSEKELLGKSVIDLYHLDDLDKVKENLKSFSETGKIIYTDFKLLKKNGGFVEVDLKFNAVRDTNGKILYSNAAWRDVTELKEIQRALFIEKDKTQKMLQKIETLFGQQVSEEIVTELIADTGGKTHLVTIMFLDIRDFSFFADSRPPAEVASFQNIVFSELIDIIKKHNGITNQILGDGLMAVFGAPIENKSHAINSVTASYALIEKINELHEKRKIPKTRIGIGLHTGQVVAGNIGNTYRKQYSLTGTAVIIASRIEQLNKVYKSQVLISEQVYEAIKNNSYPITKLGLIELKGIKKAVGIYKLL